MFEDKCYTRNFLGQVITKIDFINPLKGIESNLAPTLTKKILEKFPIAEPRTAINYELQFTSEEADSSTATQTRSKQWLFHGRNREKSFSLTSNSVILGYSKYKSFEELSSEFLDIITVLLVNYKEAQPSFLGLRYVNNINLNETEPLDWTELLHKKMLSILDFPPDDAKTRIVRAFSVLEMNFDTFNLRYQFGMPNIDYPALIRQKHFVLDLDAYYQGNFDATELASKLEEFHATIQKYFEFSITDRLREQMNATTLKVKTNVR